MNRAEKRRQLKKAKKAKPVQSASPSLQQQAPTTQQALNLAVQHHAVGRLPEAESIYQRILQADPDQPVALHLLGMIAHQVGKIDIAVDLIIKALAIKPNYVEAHSNLGSVLRELGRLDDAVDHCEKAIEIKPDFANAHSNLGNALMDLGKLNEAVDSYHKALAIEPNFAGAHNNLGNALKSLGKLDEAVVSYHKALAIEPDFVEAHNNLGNALKNLGKLDEAVARYRKALAIKPDFAGAHSNLGRALKDLGKLNEAVDSCHKALAIEPDFAEAHSNLGNALKNLGKLDEAVASYRNALRINPDFAEAHSNLGNALKDLGKLDEAVASYRKALSIKPDFTDAHTNLLLTEQYRPGHNTQTLYELHLEWDEHHGRKFRAVWPKHRNIPEPDRRLRIGFVSPDLGRHPVGYFIVGLLENLPTNEIETVCYSDRLNDDLTDRIKAATGIWRNVRGISDENLIKTISDDEIDILFDLTGHSANNRLRVFARKPAPLQVTWAGYVGTTGLSAIDYLVTDIHSTRADEEKYYSENIVLMPDGWLCYAPPSHAPAVGPSPFKRNKSVTFGSFSGMAKINPEVVSVWAKILHRVADSCLLLKYGSFDSIANTKRLLALFDAEGVNQSRLILEGHSQHAELLARYNDVDIALDPFPYSGGLTTYEALWMGVPVITVPGETFASRHSLSHLSTIGLPELVARNRDDYVKLAVGLANDGDRLASLRAELRQKMASSPICDREKFAAGFATIMRQIWCNWCLSKGHPKRPPRVGAEINAGPEFGPLSGAKRTT